MTLNLRVMDLTMITHSREGPDGRFIVGSCTAGRVDLRSGSDRQIRSRHVDSVAPTVARRAPDQCIFNQRPGQIDFEL
ncbi:hypothetical protein AVEN_10111-1 [Araneus ventricosus]|uniref:Uncharacterized protein n=1 Tax=Araneus ventricosus TaxID=182803 RepID=A0A4Y2WDD2_ARAVE|nr:hypothetical protein AVEN_10111-1 [Araneus ventricosus]